MKYMGSKARISKDIAPIINKLIDDNNINLYIEPFVGGANMIEHIKCKNRIGADSNEYLISMWNALKSGWKPPSELTKELYNDIKDNKDKYGKPLTAIAGFCATYNAKWFGGYAGIVETKADTIRNYYDESVRNIIKQLPKLKDIDFIATPYVHFTDYKNCLLYCDIPYKNTTEYGTTQDFNHDEFWEWAEKMSKNNIVLVSEYDAPVGSCIFEKTLTTTLDKNSRKQDTEKLYLLN